MFKKLLVAIDGSDIAMHALRTAISEGIIWNAEVHVVYVINPGISRGMMLSPTPDVLNNNPELLNELLVTEANRAIEEVEDYAATQSALINIHREWGDPREEILTLASEINADLIILGSTGKTGLSRLLLGSVSSSVLEQSTITTMIVRQKE